MSISSEITSIGENLKKDYQAIANLGADLTNVDKNIENIAELLDGVYDNLPKTEYQEGTEINLGKTIKGKLDYENGVVGIGQSSQDSTQGYNLLPKNAPTRLSANGLTCTIKEDGRIILNGTTTALTTFYVLGNGDVTQTRLTLPAGTYTGTLGKDVVANNRLMVNIMKTNNTQVFPSQLRWVTYETITLDEETYVGNMNITALSDTTFNNYELDIMVLSGTYTSSNMPNFEKYTGGQASPNPSYPQEIKYVRGKNLFDKNSVTTGYYYNLNGALMASNNWNVEQVEVQPNTNYYLSGNNLNNEIAGIVLLDKDKNFISLVSSYKNVHLITTTATTKYIGLSIANYSDNSDMNTMQLEEGSQATPYLPYNTIEEVVSGKNRYTLGNIKEWLESETSVGITRSVINNSILKLNGTTSSNGAVIGGRDLGIVLPKGTYTYSVRLINGSAIRQTGQDITFSLYGYSTNTPSYVLANRTLSNILANNNSETFTITEDLNLRVYSYGNASGIALDNCELSIQLEQGSTATTYEPYITPTSYQLSLGDRKVFEGDYFWRDNNGKFYHHHKMGEYVFTGNETGQIQNNHRFAIPCDTNNIPIPKGVNSNNDIGNILSNIAKASSNGITWSDTTSNLMSLYVTGESARIYISLAGLTTENQYRNALQENNCVYQLLTETDEEITDITLISQLNAWYNAHSLNGTTIITSNGNLPMIIKCRALKGE